MCEPTTIMAASMGMNVVSGMAQGQASKAQADQQAVNQQWQANTQATQNEWQANTQATQTEYQSEVQAASAEYSARVARDDALATAAYIRKQQRLAIGTSQATSAASGVVVGEGSAAEADRQIYQDSEQDAFMSILSGEREGRALDADAALTRQSGKANAAYMRQSGKANADLMRQTGDVNASSSRQAGANAEANGNLGAVGSVLGGAYKITSQPGWKTASVSSGDGLSQGDRRKLGVY